MSPRSQLRVLPPPVPKTPLPAVSSQPRWFQGHPKQHNTQIIYPARFSSGSAQASPAGAGRVLQRLAGRVQWRLGEMQRSGGEERAGASAAVHRAEDLPFPAGCSSPASFSSRDCHGTPRALGLDQVTGARLRGAERARCILGSRKKHATRFRLYLVTGLLWRMVGISENFHSSNVPFSVCFF